jgi:hypothetical protein
MDHTMKERENISGEIIIQITTIHLQRKQHSLRVLQVLLDQSQECDRFPPINKAVIVSQSNVHHLM